MGATALQMSNASAPALARLQAMPMTAAAATAAGVRANAAATASFAMSSSKCFSASAKSSHCNFCARHEESSPARLAAMCARIGQALGHVLSAGGRAGSSRIFACAMSARRAEGVRGAGVAAKIPAAPPPARGAHGAHKALRRSAGVLGPEDAFLAMAMCSCARLVLADTTPRLLCLPCNDVGLQVLHWLLGGFLVVVLGHIVHLDAVMAGRASNGGGSPGEVLSRSNARS